MFHPLNGKESSSKSGSLYSLCSSFSPDPKLPSSPSSPSPSHPTYWFQHVISFVSLPGGDPQVWDTQYSSTAKHPSPSYLITRCCPVITQVQYPLSLWKLRGLKPTISDFLKSKLLQPTFSSFKTPIRAVKKPSGTYCLAQDPYPINLVAPLHPAKANLHTLLSTVPSGNSHFLVLDLKDSFSYNPIYTQL